MAIAADYRAVVAHLPPGAILRVDDVPWHEYEQLLADLGPGYPVHIFYDRGRMEIMTPTSGHERAKMVVHSLVMALSDELDVDVESLGSTTYKAETRTRGAEPDDSFYIQNAFRIIGREDIDLARDPPPDLVVEIDRTSASLDKLSIYGGLAVPEVWRLVGNTIHIHVLTGDRYDEVASSRALPFLTASVLSTFVQRALTEGTRTAASAFRRWIREHRPR